MKCFSLRNGAQVPAVGLGTWQSAAEDVGLAIDAAIRMGYRHLDCASIYGNQQPIGAALAQVLNEKIVLREQIWVTSKLWNDSHAPDQVEPALRETLDDLRLQYVDLYLIHWPVAVQKGVHVPADPSQYIGLDEPPLETTWTAMERCVDLGLCRHIGVSNCSVNKLSQLCNSAARKPEVNQVELHPYLQQSGLVEFCHRRGILVTAYSPLGSPTRPAGMKQDGEPSLFADPVLARIAADHGVTIAQVLISWAVTRGTAAIPKSTDVCRMKENLAAADIALSAEAMRAIAQLDRHHRFVDGRFWEMPGGPYTPASVWDE